MLIRALESQGVEVVEVQIPNETRFWARPHKLFWQFLKVRGRKADVLILAELNQVNMPFAKLLTVTKGIPLVFDPFFSRYDSLVMTRETVRPGGLRAGVLWCFDWLSFNCSDVLLADTSAHGQYYAQEFGVKKPMVVVPIGANTSHFTPLPFLLYPGTGPFRVLFWGTFIPLQGVEYILEAARICLTADPDIQFDLIGSGSTFKEMEQLAISHCLSNVCFLGRKNQATIVAQAKEAHVCLGIFGNTNKTQRVVPNKLFEALALAKPVISARTPATDEWLVAGLEYQACAVANGQSLAEAILSLKHDGDRLRSIADKGLQRFRQEFSEEAIGEKLVDALRALS